MKWKFIALIFLIFSIAFFPGCAAQKGIIVYSETYWREMIALDPAFQPHLRELASRYHYSLAFIDAPANTNYFEHLRRNILDLPSDMVITGTLLSAEVVKIAPLFPLKKFAVIAMPHLDTALPANVIPIYSQRAAAFREAGKIAGLALADGRFPQIGQKVGVILAGLTMTEKEMLSEFERGFSETGDTDKIVVEEIGTVTDRVKATLAVENLLNRDVKLFLVKTYGLSGACLEKIRQAGAYFIIEDFPSYKLSPERLILSIEDDYTKPLDALLAAKDFTPPTPPVLPALVRKGVILQNLKEN
jgi:hypothetical protein